MEDIKTKLMGMRDELEDLDGELDELKLKRKNMLRKIVRVTRDNVELATELGLPTQLSMRGRKKAEGGDEGDEGDDASGADATPAG